MNQAPVLLAIDTSLGKTSVAIWKDGALQLELHGEESGQQSRELVPMIESALKQTGLQYADLDALASTIGPGGFTGIRVGLTTARSIALVTGKPLIGLSTLEVIAYSARDGKDVVAVINAYREQWYIQRFRMNGTMHAMCEPMLVDDKGKKAVAHGAKIVEAIPGAAMVAALAHDKWVRGERKWPTDPLYIREPDAKLPVAQ
jgi:tRNA threonylcarbamoyladenosine biosynthesis protein TsaB